MPVWCVLIAIVPTRHPVPDAVIAELKGREGPDG